MLGMQSILYFALTGALVAFNFAAIPAQAAPDSAAAISVFEDARTICERDHGVLWGRSLCGPILLVDYRDRSVIANQADAGGVLKASGSVFVGTIPKEVIIANTPTEWSGTRWTQLVWPVTTEVGKRNVLLAHELFHRIQPMLGLTRSETANHHLDTLEGRYLLQLEWRALAKALAAKSTTNRGAAISDALLFRHERYRLFPAAAKEEAALEIAEGVPEYTGVRLGLTTVQARTAFAIYDLSAFVAAPTFVRSFAYATGPAYGLLLDQADPAWKSKLNSGPRLDELLSTALKFKLSSAALPKARVALYDDGALRASEVRRDVERRTRLVALKARLVDGPVLILPLVHSNYQFNPQTLTPLEGFGTIYPTMRITDDWGALEVEKGGALVRDKPSQATVSAVNMDAGKRKGDGWSLSLSAGWTVEPGPRAGDLIVVQPPLEAFF